jgi:rubrerythrin
MFTLSEIIDLAVRIEENGEKAYRDASGKCPDLELARWLARLADDEAEHGKWFLALREKTGGETVDPELEDLGREILRGILGDQSFALRDADFSKMEAVKDLIALSIEFERDTALFYEMLVAFMEGGDALQHLQAIIDEENLHVQVLEKALAEER